MTTKQKKRVRWAESDDILGDDEERGSKMPRRTTGSPTDTKLAGDSTTASAGPDTTAICAATEDTLGCIVVKEDADASLMEEIAEAEAAYQPPDIDFVASSEFPIEPFSLREERENGNFDAHGNYTPHSGRAASFKDAWLDSLPADMENVTFSVAEDGASVAEAGPSQAPTGAAQLPHPEAEPESEPDKAELSLLKANIVQMLTAGETVLGALRRLSEVGSAAVPGQANPGSLEARRAQHMRMKTGRTVPPENRVDFDNLTDWSSTLLKYGDYHVHTDSREQMEARLARSAVDDNSVTTTLTSATSAAIDDEEDMFRDEPTQPGEATSSPTSGSDHHPDLPSSSSRPQAIPAVSATPSEASVVASSMAAETQSDVVAPESPVGVIELGAVKNAAEEVEYEGFSYDSKSGYWFNSAEGYFYDAERQLFADSITGQFYKYHNGAYVAA